MKKLGKKLIVLIIIIALAAFAVTLIKRKKQRLSAAPTYGMRPTPVKLVSSRRGSLDVKTDYIAVVEPVQTSVISARLIGSIEQIFCDEGDVVKAGDVLIKLDDREIKDNIVSVEADIAKALSELEANKATVNSLKDSVTYWTLEAKRDKTLAEKNAIPVSQAEATADKASEFEGRFKAAEHQSEALKHLADSLRAKKDRLETQLCYCTIRSPYDGVIKQRLVDVGTMASPGMKLLTMEDRSQWKLAFDVPQEDLSKVREGSPAQFLLGGDLQDVEITHMYPSLDKARMLRAEIYLSDAQAGGLKSGQYVPVSVLVEKIPNAVIIPTSCIVESPEHGKYVFVEKDGRLTHKEVEILATSQDEAAVKGIEPDEGIVTNTFLGWTILSGGEKVEVIK